MERDPDIRALPLCVTHFNSRAHVERDMADIHMPMSKIISTHALTWSATII